MERRWRRWGARLSALCTYVHKQFPAFSPSPSHEDEVLKAAHNSAAAPHIHVGAASYSVTPHHFAFEHLRDMRGNRGLGARVIDEDGNFVSSKDEAKGGVGTNTSRASSVIAPAAISGYDLFEPQWEQEFLQSEYLHGYRVFSRWLTCACFLGSQASISWFTAPLGTMPEHCPLNSPFRQGVYGRLSVGMPNFLLQLLCSLIIRLSIPYIPRPQRVRLYPTLVVLWCLVLHGSYIHVGAVRELIRGLRGPAGMCVCSLILECVLLFKNVFSYRGMCSLTSVIIRGLRGPAGMCVFVCVFSYFRMCSLTMECVLSLQ